jgi:hypothetical protein
VPGFNIDDLRGDCRGTTSNINIRQAVLKYICIFLTKQAIIVYATAKHAIRLTLTPSVNHWWNATINALLIPVMMQSLYKRMLVPNIRVILTQIGH